MAVQIALRHKVAGQGGVVLHLPLLAAFLVLLQIVPADLLLVERCVTVTAVEGDDVAGVAVDHILHRQIQHRQVQADESLVPLLFGVIPFPALLHIGEALIPDAHDLRRQVTYLRRTAGDVLPPAGAAVALQLGVGHGGQHEGDELFVLRQHACLLRRHVAQQVGEAARFHHVVGDEVPQARVPCAVAAGAHLPRLRVNLQ